jgi:type VI protein secretion system component VasK
MRIVLFILGAVGVLLGGLWLLQGLAIVRMAPILCVADCEPLEGPSPVWAVIGLVVLLAGAYAFYRGWRHGRIRHIPD